MPEDPVKSLRNRSKKLNKFHEQNNNFKNGSFNPNENGASLLETYKDSADMGSELNDKIDSRHEDPLADHQNLPETLYTITYPSKETSSKGSPNKKISIRNRQMEQPKAPIIFRGNVSQKGTENPLD